MARTARLCSTMLLMALALGLLGGVADLPRVEDTCLWSILVDDAPGPCRSIAYDLLHPVLPRAIHVGYGYTLDWLLLVIPVPVLMIRWALAPGRDPV